jgi:hypothetical protein
LLKFKNTIGPQDTQPPKWRAREKQNQGDFWESSTTTWTHQSTTNRCNRAPGEENPIAPQAETSVSSIALPPFWGNRPELWFSMAEAKFNLALTRITMEETKFYHVLTVLSPEIAAEVADVITTPDPTEPYTQLKEVIIERLSLTETQKLKQLFSGQELGSRKPSQLQRHMKSLVESSKSVNEQVLREPFLQQMIWQNYEIG